MKIPSRESIIAALQAAGTAHHDYEVNTLQCVDDFSGLANGSTIVR